MRKNLIITFLLLIILLSSCQPRATASWRLFGWKCQFTIGTWSVGFNCY
ncbi:MAG: hypothetical protein QNJ38_05720 [Prochloraceae cyanobacterium]|nr:hypothetical protein [Prochloraceae cyanobacterium]